MAIETVVGSRAWIYSHNIGRNAAAGMGFSMPIGVAPAKDGVLFVASRGSDTNPNQRISKVTLDQDFIHEFGRVGEEQGSHVFLTGVALDRDENVYTTDEWLNRVSVFDNDGNFLRSWGEAGESEGQFNGPSGLAFDQPLLSIFPVNLPRLQPIITECIGFPCAIILSLPFSSMIL